jgi:hypothetical protein
MSEASLERSYRRLLACYPPHFRAGQGDEMLGVLMASAGQDQRRPGLLDTLDVLRSAAGMRLRSLRSGPENRGWADGLAMFSVLAPLFLVLSSLLGLVWPLRVAHIVVGRHAGTPARLVVEQRFGWNWHQLLGMSGFRIALTGQVVVAALVLLGLRRLALLAIAGSVVYWLAARYWIPYPLQLLTTSIYLLEAAALTVSPGPRHGRHLVNWGHGVVLLLAAGAVQASTLWIHRHWSGAGQQVGEAKPA